MNHRKLQPSALLLAALCLSHIFAARLCAQNGDWKWVNPQPLGAEPMYAIQMIDAQTLVAAGRDGHIMRSADGGQTWTIQAAAESSLIALDFGDAQHGWACGRQGLLVKTSNGGLTWTPQATPGTFDFSDVEFTDSQNGWLAGPGVILRTTDGGSTWQNVSPMTFFSPTAINFINPQVGWFCGTTGQIMQTTNGGTTWTQQTSNTGNDLNDIRFLDAQTGWACGVAGTILKTSNGGNTWTIQPSGETFAQFRTLAICDAQTALVAGKDAKMLRTTNGGSVWSSVFSPQTSLDFYAVAAAGNKLAYTLAPPDNFPGTGKMALSTDQGLTWQPLTRSLAPPRCDFRDVIIRSPQEWWAMGNSVDSGYVFKTTSAGATWSRKVFPRGINTGALFDAQTGWVAGAGNQIYKTTDGGTTWTTQNPSNVTADYNDIHVLNAQTLWVAGYNNNDEGVVIKSTDGGTTWTQTQGIAAEAINSIHFTDDQKGWAVGNNGVIRKTGNGGQTWTTVSIESEFGQLFSVFFTSAGTGYIVGESGRSYKTTDGGQTWTGAGLGGFKGLIYYKILFTHPDTGFAARSDGKIFKTVNAAGSWTETALSPARSLYALAMLDSRRGIAGGESAAILSTEVSATTEITPPLAVEEQVFPNPATREVFVRMKRKILSADLTDMTGNLFTATPGAGNRIDLTGLRPGIYLLRIRTDRGLVMKKIIRE